MRNSTPVSNIGEAVPISLFWASNGLNYRKYVSNFPSTWLADRQWPYQQANHSAYSNPGTQVGTQNKDFGAVSQTDLTRSSFPSVVQAIGNEPFPPLICLGALPNLYCEMSLLLYRRFARNCVQNYCPRMQNVHFRFACVSLYSLPTFFPPDVRPNSRKNFKFHFQKYRTLNNGVWKYCWNGYIWNVPGLYLFC